MPPLHLRQEFPTLKAFKEALHAWAIEAHFEPRILKSDTGRVRVGCKRDPACPFVIRCNWERKGGREPLARVTVLRDRHTCLNGVEWMAGMGVNGGMGGSMNGGMGMGNGIGSVEIRSDDAGNIVGGVRVLGPVGGDSVNSTVGVGTGGHAMHVPVLPKVQRNSASRLPFLMEILPRLMCITKETTPVEIREVLMREYGAEVHLQQCRRAKTEILKKTIGDGGEGRDGAPGIAPSPVQQQKQNTRPPHPQVQHSAAQINLTGQQMENMSSESGSDANQPMFGDMNGGANGSSHHAFVLQTGVQGSTGERGSNATLGSRHMGGPMSAPNMLSTQGGGNADQPVRCPYCINLRWMRSIKDAVEHMSMHVVTD